METKPVEKVEKLIQIIKNRASKNVKEVADETYLQVNQVSFQQNFKALIGHYKKPGSYSSNSVLNV